MEAFRIFLEHWKVEENKIIKKKTKEKKLKKVERVVWNRNLKDFLRKTLDKLDKIITGEDQGEEGLETLKLIFRRLDVIVETLVDTEEIFGLCDNCEGGIVKCFLGGLEDMEEDVTFLAVCVKCHSCYLQVDELYPFYCYHCRTCHIHSSPH